MGGADLMVECGTSRRAAAKNWALMMLPSV
jgi:hypothetical protein